MSGQHATFTPWQRQLTYVSGAFGLGFSQMVQFLVPLRANELGASLEFIGLLVGAGSLLPAFLSVPLGGLIDRLGARRMFLAGSAASAVVAVFFLTATNPWHLVPLQLVFGGARGLGWIASQTYASGFAPEGRRAEVMGKFTFWSNIGTLAGPLVVGAIAELVGFRLSFAYLVAFAVTFAVIAYLLPEVPTSAPTARGRGGSFGAALRLARNPGVVVVLVLTFCRVTILRTWNSFFPVFLVGVGFGPFVTGTVMSGTALVATLTAFLAGALSRRVTNEILIVVVLGTGALGLALAPQVASVPLVYIPPLLIGIGSGLSLPLLLTVLSDAAPDDQRGLALGLRTGVNQAANTVSPMFMGPLITWIGTAAGFLATGAFTACMLVVGAFLHRRNAGADGGGESARRAAEAG